MKAQRQQEFQRIASQVTPSVASYLARRSYPLSKDDLDDLVAEVLIVLWRRIGDVPAGAEIPWAIGVARNVRRNAVRKFTNGQQATAQVRPTNAGPSAEDVIIADDSVRTALASLTEDDRDLLLLHFWDGLTSGEIALVFGISANAAAVRLTRAQERFRRSIDVANIV
jgi:RNA polymerase sigma-70 factor (ECF subfamily)